MLLSANTWMPQLETSRRMRLLKGASMRGFRATARVLGHVPARTRPVRQRRRSAALRRGPRALLGSRDGGGSADGRDDYLAGLGSIRCPVLSVLGKGDRLLAHHVGARGWAGHIPGVELWLVGDELDRPPDHMTLVTDPLSRPVWERVAGWMDRHA